MKDLLTVKESLNSPQESHTVLRFCHKTLSEFDLRHRFCLEYGNIVRPSYSEANEAIVSPK